MTIRQILITVLVIVFGTVLTRSLPFLIFPDSKESPDSIKYLGQVLPYAIIGMLVVYCLKNVNLLNFPFGIPEGIALIYVVLVHHRRHNLLLSIGGGTILYMVMVQFLFPV
ncbi:MAG TPA: AzlD domain-containing protein [Flexilinea sp.]|nr:AzlD domain-containing protein [Flexilinea sp.]